MYIVYSGSQNWFCKFFISGTPSRIFRFPRPMQDFHIFLNRFGIFLFPKRSLKHLRFRCRFWNSVFRIRSRIFRFLNYHRNFHVSSDYLRISGTDVIIFYFTISPIFESTFRDKKSCTLGE